MRSSARTIQGSQTQRAARAEDNGATGVVFRRRRTDWLDEERSPEEDEIWSQQRAMVDLAAAMLAASDGYTAEHSDDVALLCCEVADQLGVEGPRRARLLAAAQLHDVGKVAIPRETLDKPGPLDEHEWDAVRQHTLIGESILCSVPEMAEVARLVRHSHERFDGDGYPDGLRGEEIPLGSRIVFCVDAFHAIRSDRPYRPGRDPVDAMAEIRRHSGTQFDPVVVDALERTTRYFASPSLRGGLRRTARGRRLLALLLVLGTAASAMAAVGIRSIVGEDPAPVPVDCHLGAPCLPADLGGLGRLPPAPEVAPGSTARDVARRRGAKRRLARTENSRGTAAPGHTGSGGRTRRRAGTSPAPIARGGSGATAPSEAPATGGGLPTRPTAPSGQGRSETAPGRPAQPGKPPRTGPSGRSEAAPAKPEPLPGAFGHGNQRTKN